MKITLSSTLNESVLADDLKIGVVIEEGVNGVSKSSLLAISSLLTLIDDRHDVTILYSSYKSFIAENCLIYLTTENTWCYNDTEIVEFYKVIERIHWRIADGLVPLMKLKGMIAGSRIHIMYDDLYKLIMKPKIADTIFGDYTPSSVIHFSEATTAIKVMREVVYLLVTRVEAERKRDLVYALKHCVFHRPNIVELPIGVNPKLLKELFDIINKHNWGFDPDTIKFIMGELNYSITNVRISVSGDQMFYSESNDKKLEKSEALYRAGI